MQIEQNALPDLDGVTQLAVRGDVTYTQAPELRDALFRLIRDDVRAVVVTLGEVGHMDTTGVAVLVEAVQAARGSGPMLLLCEPSEGVRRIFKLAGFDDALECCCSEPSEVAGRLEREMAT